MLDRDIHLIVYLDVPSCYSRSRERPSRKAQVCDRRLGGRLQGGSPSLPRGRKNFGFELWQPQQGERPRDFRPLPSIGTGVFELRDQDERAWYRVIYLSRINDVLYVLHCFEKKSREMPRKDFEKAKQRLKALKARLAEEKRHEKRS